MPSFVEYLEMIGNNDNRLDLRGNQIGTAGAQALATALRNNTTLTSLDLYDNQIGAAGAQIVQQNLVSHPNTSLSLLLKPLAEQLVNLS